jgi:hypothetical protein
MDDQLYSIPSDSARRRPSYHASNSRGARVATTATSQNTGTPSGRGDRTGGTFKAGNYLERTEGGRSSWSHELDRTRSVDRRCLEVSLDRALVRKRLTHPHFRRYLRVKFGVRWTDLKDLQEPLRIGEVLILPVTGFSPGVGLFGAKSPFGKLSMPGRNPSAQEIEGANSLDLSQMRTPWWNIFSLAAGKGAD